MKTSTVPALATFTLNPDWRVWSKKATEERCLHVARVALSAYLSYLSTGGVPQCVEDLDIAPDEIPDLPVIFAEVIKPPSEVDYHRLYGLSD